MDQLTPEFVLKPALPGISMSGKHLWMNLAQVLRELVERGVAVTDLTLSIFDLDYEIWHLGMKALAEWLLQEGEHGTLKCIRLHLAPKISGKRSRQVYANGFMPMNDERIAELGVVITSKTIKDKFDANRIDMQTLDENETHVHEKTLNDIHKKLTSIQPTNDDKDSTFEILRKLFLSYVPHRRDGGKPDQHHRDTSTYGRGLKV